MVVEDRRLHRQLAARSIIYKTEYTDMMAAAMKLD